MIAIVETASVLGIDAFPIEVEVDVSSGLPSFGIVGLPDTACRESQDRVRSAIRNSGFSFPLKKITVNLAPANLKKEGSGYDLPIAIGILIGSGQVAGSGERCVFAGELALDGKLRPVNGALSLAASLSTSGKKLIFPYENRRETSCVEGVALYPARNLREAIDAMTGDAKPNEPIPKTVPTPRRFAADFSDVKGQLVARRGLEVAAAGGHNVLMIGPPGSGKTMLAKRIPTILSDLGFEEAVETTKIHSVAGALKNRDSLIEYPPFRTPHHTISYPAMVGGGSHPRPGEISLAHNGVLFLDELPEFRRNVLEALRQPLEEGRIVVARAALALSFPSRFMLVAAMNPCPCGHFGDPKKECSCSPLQVKNYMGRVSGPLVDRIDLHIHVHALRMPDLTGTVRAEVSASIKERVGRARKKQHERYRGAKMLNSRLEGKEVEANCEITDEAGHFLKKALEDFGFSARAYHKILKIGRTVADLDEKPLVELRHIQEAIQYRSLDRGSWREHAYIDNKSK